MLNEQEIATVKKTVPLLEAAGPTLTKHFYERLFEHNPELKNVFNLSHQHSGKQPVALFEAVAAYARHIEDPSVLESAISRIANKHVGFDIQPEHYDIVGYHLINTLSELGGKDFPPEVADVWRKAYAVLAGFFIEKEGSIYHLNASTNGGWQGARPFRLIEKRMESELVKSLVFEPLDKQPVKHYEPGQYISLKLNIKNHPYQEIRQYSLSNKANGRTYQISVKREVEGVPGIVSNYLHDGLRLGDVIDLFPPSGDFYFVDRQKPVVLISAGVGITPMAAMLDHLTESGYDQPVYFLHACENNEQHSFAEFLSQKAQIHEQVKSFVWYKSDRVERENTFHGLLDLTQVEANLPISQADFYLCGPVPFMQFAKQQLATLGVEPERIHYEVFGPHEVF